MQHFDLIIIGAGSGNTLLTPFFDGWSVAIIERDLFGGTCMNRGCIPSKMYVYAADVADLALGQTAWVTADAYGTRRFSGRVIRIGETLGQKGIRTERPNERTDTRVLETLVELDAGTTLPIGLRVDAFIARGGGR